MNEYNDMMREIEKQGKLTEVMSSLKGQASEFCKVIKEKRKDKKIFFTGCGDSYFAGLATRDFFVKRTGITCFPMMSLEFAKYGINEVDENTTVVAVSMSGNVARTLEAIEEAQAKDAFVIGITNSITGQLYQKANYSLLLNVEEEPGWTPGTLTYAGTLLALYIIAIELSNDKKSLYDNLEKTLTEISRLMDTVKENALSVGNNLMFNRHTMPIYVIGAGPSYATSKYAAAKFLEICDTVAIGQESEELAHQEFWVINKNNPVFVIAPQDEGFGRTCEIATCLREFGNDLYVISSDEKLCGLGKYSFNIKDVPEEFSPLIYDIPMQLVAYFYSKAKGLDPDRRSHNDPFRKKVSRLMTRGKVCEM